MVSFVNNYREELRSIPLWGMKTYKMAHYNKVKVTKAQLKNKCHEGEWVIVDRNASTFTIQRIS